MMLRELGASSDSVSTNLIAICSTILNWISHLYICNIVGSYYHVLSLGIIIFIYWCHNSLRIFILLVNYIMNVHIFCHYYESLNTPSILMLITASMMLIIIAFIKLYTARRQFMETCFTTTIIFYIILNFYIFIYYIISYWNIDIYYSMDKLLLSLSLWFICCWNVKVNDQSNTNAQNKHYNNRLTITAIMGIISQALFLLRFIPFIIEYNNNDIPLIILIILCIHIGSILIIFLSIDLSNELQLKLTKKTISFGFSLILSIWVEYLLVVFYFAIYFVINYNINSMNVTATSSHQFPLGIATDFGRYNFILLSIPGSIPWVMIMFANYRRDNIYHHMIFTEIFENYNKTIPVKSIQKISDILVRNGIGKSIFPFPIKTDVIIDSLFAIIYLFGYDDDITTDNDHDVVNNETMNGMGSNTQNVNKLSLLNKQYEYLKIKRRENKIKFIKYLMKKYIKSNAIKINMAYNLLFYHENIALFLSICFGISRFISCILMPIIWSFILRDIDNDMLSLDIIQNWVIYVVLMLYSISFIPFAYNMYCVLNCEYYFFLITPIKTSNKITNSIGYLSGNGKLNGNENILPRFVENTKRNEIIWNLIQDKNIAAIIIQYLPNSKHM